MSKGTPVPEYEAMAGLLKKMGDAMEEKGRSDAHRSRPKAGQEVVLQQIMVEGIQEDIAKPISLYLYGRYSNGYQGGKHNGR